MSRRDTKISQRIEDLAAKLVASIPGQRAAWVRKVWKSRCCG